MAIAEKLSRRNWRVARDRAIQLGIGPSVISKKRVVGQSPAWTEAETAEIRAGRAAGESTKEVARRLSGRTLNAVRGYGRRC
jgi:hypothetical protein